MLRSRRPRSCPAPAPLHCLGAAAASRAAGGWRLEPCRPGRSRRGRCRADRGRLSRPPSPRLPGEGCAPGWRGARQRLSGGPAAPGSASWWPSPRTSGEVSGGGGGGGGRAGGCPGARSPERGGPAACPEGWRGPTPRIGPPGAHLSRFPHLRNPQLLPDPGSAGAADSQYRSPTPVRFPHLPELPLQPGHPTRLSPAPGAPAP